MEITMRPAVAEDAEALAALYAAAAGGIDEYLWARDGGGSARAMSVGAARFARDHGHVSFRHCLIAERAGAPLAMAHAYPDGPWEEGLAMGLTEADPVFAALNGLEAPAAYYISALSVAPAARGRGLGTRLLEAVEADAKAARFEVLDLIVFSDNPRAEGLYRRLGFAPHDRAALPAFLGRPAREARLLVKSIP